MTAPDKHERRFPTLAVVLCVGMMLPVLYVLSSGPVYWLIDNDYIKQGDTAATLAIWFYAPLTWIIEHSSLFRRIWGLWLKLWIK